MTPHVPTHPRGQAGFSLIELLVAMTVTLIITGAMYGLLAGGQNAFRREPELTDRQQAIRLGMDRIQRDVLIAGQRLSGGAQAFTDTPNPNGAGVAGPNGNTDILEIIGSPNECPNAIVTKNNGANLGIAQPVPNCVPDPGPVLIVYPNGVGKPAWGHNAHGAGKNPALNFPSGQQGNWPASGLQKSPADLACAQSLSTKVLPCTAPQNPIYFTSLVVVRYVIWPDADGIPGLWRSDIGGFDDATSSLVNPDPNSNIGSWRLVSRGVEDLQVRYWRGDKATGGWFDRPGDIAAGGGAAWPNNMVREVEVILGARTVQTNLQGARDAATGSAVRGQLQAIIVPRAAPFYLGLQDPNLWQ